MCGSVQAPRASPIREPASGRARKKRSQPSDPPVRAGHPVRSNRLGTELAKRKITIILELIHMVSLGPRCTLRIAQPPAEPLGARDATGAADMAMPPRAEPLGTAMLEQPIVQELEKRIRSMSAAYEGLSVSTDGIRKSQRCYVLNVHGPGDFFA